ncbi:hypothetical protein [Streptomyces sp. NPDC087297]|uniref:hypothetical protein n=1 Tax=Streptomyces sp. NPDC087297 TaxID=3365778 RepID=UPI0037F5CA43
MDIKLELVAVPVTDIDRAKAFDEKLGFNAGLRCPDHLRDRMRMAARWSAAW